MGITVTWIDDQKTALLYAFDSHWTWDDFYNIKLEADALLDTVDHQVPLIFDLSESIKLPSGALSKIRTLTLKRHPNGHPILLVGMTPFIREMLRITLRLLRNIDGLYIPVNTMDEAMQIVAEYTTQT